MSFCPQIAPADRIAGRATTHNGGPTQAAQEVKVNFDQLKATTYFGRGFSADDIGDSNIYVCSPRQS
jgi:hypothetical protein